MEVHRAEVALAGGTGSVGVVLVGGDVGADAVAVVGLLCVLVCEWKWFECVVE